MSADYERLRQLAERVEAVCEPGPTTPGGVAELARGVLVLLAELVAIRAAGKEWKVCWEAAMARAEQAEAALVAVREERDAAQQEAAKWQGYHKQDCGDLTSRAEAAERERDTLRAELEAVEPLVELMDDAAIEHDYGKYVVVQIGRQAWDEAVAARAALSTVDTERTQE